MKIINEVDCAATPVTLKSGLATKFTIRELSFAEWVDVLGIRSTSVSALSKAQRKARRAKQISAFDADGNTLKISDDELLRAPRKVYVRIMAGIDDFISGGEGEVIVAGDGIDRPIIYRLGTPIKIGGGEGDVDGIKELEFSAATGADIEDVIAEAFPAAQAFALIKGAKPLTKGLGLSVLPSWAFDQITIGDGVAILDKVLPSFLE